MDNMKVDIIGIGSLNLDYMATAKRINSLPPDIVDETMKKLEYGAEKIDDLDYIKDVMSNLGPDTFSIALGGSAFNTIRAMAAIGSGMKTGYMGVACNTEVKGLNFMETMKRLSIDSSYTKFCRTQRMGFCISINKGGTRSFLCYPGSNNKMADHVEKNYKAMLKYLKESGMIHITQFADEKTTEILSGLLQDARKENPSVKISCDPGFCWLKGINPAIMNILKLSDFVFVNAKEYRIMAGGTAEISDIERAKRIFEVYRFENTELVLKNDSEIKLYSTTKGEIIEEIFDIDTLSHEEIMDATGAGDAFDAGFLTMYLLKGKAGQEGVKLGMELMRAKLIIPAENFYKELSLIYKKYASSL
ncbi:MAG: carbohydrate kinase family protein [Clostridiaceae bacterium]